MKVNNASKKCSTENTIKVFRTSTIIWISKLEKKIGEKEGGRKRGREKGREREREGEEVFKKVEKTFQDIRDLWTKLERKYPK